MHSLNRLLVFSKEFTYRYSNTHVCKVSYGFLSSILSFPLNINMYLSLLCFAIGYNTTKCPFICLCCRLLSDYSNSYFSQSLAHFYLVFIFGGFCQLWRKKERKRACLMPLGSTPCFPCVPGVGRQLKVQTQTHSLTLCMARTQRLRGLSVPTESIAHGP